jgi:hypothetical protein
LELSSSEGRGRARLWLWIVGPLLGVIVIWSVAVGLPTPECGEGGGASSLELTLFSILTAAATLACLGAAAVGLFRGWRRREPGGRQASRVLGSTLLSLYLLAAGVCFPVIFLLVLLGQSGSAC